MFTEEELLFIDFWKKKRDPESRLSNQLLKGLPIGLLFALPVFLILFTARFWFKRADMVANSLLNPIILIISVVLIASFVAVFHKRVQWEKKEQYYQELLHRQEEEVTGKG